MNPWDLTQYFVPGVSLLVQGYFYPFSELGIEVAAHHLYRRLSLLWPQTPIIIVNHGYIEGRYTFHSLHYTMEQESLQGPCAQVQWAQSDPVDGFFSLPLH